MSLTVVVTPRDTIIAPKPTLIVSRPIVNPTSSSISVAPRSLSCMLEEIYELNALCAVELVCIIGFIQMSEQKTSGPLGMHRWVRLIYCK